MKYVIDNNSLSSIFNHYYTNNFPSFWKKFNKLVQSKDIVSVREVKRELENFNRWEPIKKWANRFDDFFEKPSHDELQFIRKIFEVKHFQNNIEEKKRISGKPVADPFVIAKAKINNSIVITQEKFKDNASKIPNICQYFNIQCVNLEGFFDIEKWIF